MLKIISPWKSIALGISYLAAWVTLQAIVSPFVPETSSWPRYSFQVLLLLAPVVFVPFVGRVSCMFLASLGTVSGLFIVILTDFFFQGEYSSTDWRGIGLLIGIILGVSIFLAWPILHLQNRKLIASEHSNAGDHLIASRSNVP